jgi:hypothetical protein
MKSTPTRLAVTIAAGLILAATSAQAGVRVVNCDEGDSLQEAIDAGAGSAKPLEIELLGTCYEEVEITRDRISIIGNGDTTIVGRIRAIDSDVILLENLTITGPGTGLTVAGGRVSLNYSSISGNDGNGISVFQNGGVTLFHCIVEGNDGHGIWLNDGASRIRFTEVSHNGENGILVTNGGALRFYSGGVNFHENGSGIRASNNSSIDVGGSHIGMSNPHGIELNLGSTGMIVDSFVNANAQIGVSVTSNSAAELSGGGMEWNGRYGARVRSHSTFRLFDAIVSNNIDHGVFLATDGGLFASGSTRIEYNAPGDWVQVECRDKESSVRISGSVVINPPLVNCPDPDF